MLSLQNVALRHPDGTVLFSGLNLSLRRPARVALVGNNGAGKSTLLRILAGELPPSEGAVLSDVTPFYVPQHSTPYDGQTVAEVLGAAAKLAALRQLLAGEEVEAALLRLDDDWTVEERCRVALAHWGLSDLDLGRPLGSLSGGQKTRVFLAAIAVRQPATILLDEPSNHLDADGRALLYDLVRQTRALLVVVSHDRTLLNLLPETWELGAQGLQCYGGNYDFYAAQKELAQQAFAGTLQHQEKELRKARQAARDAADRRRKLEARAEKGSAKAGLPTIVVNNLRNSAQQSTARSKGVHEEKVEGLRRELDELRAALPDRDRMKLAFAGTQLHRGKTLFVAEGLGYSVNEVPLWAPMDFRIVSGERIAVEGANGAGKTTLLRLLLGELPPSEGSLQRFVERAVYIDQHYSLLNDAHTVLEEAQRFNRRALEAHELRIRLDWFLFGAAAIDKPVAGLSGGERMRLALACLTIADAAPDLLVLDEPTNNLDIQNMEILAAAVRAYEGTLIVVSHDARFREEVGPSATLRLTREGMVGER